VFGYPPIKLSMHMRGSVPATLEASTLRSIAPMSGHASTTIASRSSLWGPSEVAAGVAARFTLEISRDERGLPHLGGLTFVPSVRGPAQASASVRDLRADGRYEVCVVAHISGEYLVSASLDGNPVVCPPARLTVLGHRAHYENCEVLSSEALHFATTGVRRSFVIVTRDAHGKRLTFGGEHFDLRLERTDESSPVTHPLAAVSEFMLPESLQARANRTAGGLTQNDVIASASEAMVSGWATGIAGSQGVQLLKLSPAVLSTSGMEATVLHTASSGRAGTGCPCGRVATSTSLQGNCPDPHGCCKLRLAQRFPSHALSTAMDLRVLWRADGSASRS
jgi:hypothetical protein